MWKGRSRPSEVRLQKYTREKEAVFCVAIQKHHYPRRKLSYLKTSFERKKINIHLQRNNYGT